MQILTDPDVRKGADNTLLLLCKLKHRKCYRERAVTLLRLRLAILFK